MEAPDTGVFLVGEVRRMALNQKQRRFIEEYLIDLNATQAAIRAGYSKKTGFQQGYALLKKPEVKQEIAERQKDHLRRLGLTQERVLEEYMKLAYGDIMDFCNVRTERVVVGYGDDGSPISEVKNIVTFKDDLDNLPEEILAAISEVSESGGNVKIRLHDKQRALDALSKHLGLFAADKLEITGKDGGPIEIESPREEIARRIAGISARMGEDE